MYGFYTLVGLATLAKGFGGFMLPGAVALGYIVSAWDWGILSAFAWSRPRCLYLLVRLGFNYVRVPGNDEEHKTFYSRFVVHDHLRRMGGGFMGIQASVVSALRTIFAT